MLLALVVNSGSSSPTPALLLTMYSDAQCPCSAQFVSDVKHFLDNAPFNTSKYQLVSYNFRWCAGAYLSDVSTDGS